MQATVDVVQNPIHNMYVSKLSFLDIIIGDKRERIRFGKDIAQIRESYIKQVDILGNVVGVDEVCLGWWGWRWRWRRIGGRGRRGMVGSTVTASVGRGIARCGIAGTLGAWGGGGCEGW